MPTIVQGIKSFEHSVTVVCGLRFLLWSHTSKEYQVYQRKDIRSCGKLICETKKQDIAMDFLLGKR